MSKLQFPAVDVIIVNYNGMDHLPLCLEALFRSDYPDFSVVLVDNNSVDNSVNWVREHYPRVTLVENKKNIGFGRANAIGIEKGAAPLIALLNNDTRVEKGWLRNLVQVMVEEEMCGAVCSKLLFMDEPNLVNAAGGGMNFVGHGFDHDLYLLDKKEEKTIRDVFFPTAAACLIKRTVFKEIGGFDKKMFMYHEDVDLGWRMWLKGFSVKYVSDSVVYHAFGGTSMKSGSMAFRNRLGMRHSLRSLLKNYEFSTLKAVLPVFFRLNMRNFLSGVPTGFFRGLAWNVVNLPGTIKERISIQSGRRVSDQRLAPLIWQDIPLPVHFPDYKASRIDFFRENSCCGDAVDVVSNADNALGYGWYPVEIYFKDGKTPYRWTREEALFFFHHGGGEVHLNLGILGLAGIVGRERTFSITVNRDVPELFTLASDEWEPVQLKYTGAQGPVEVKLSVHDPWSPHDIFHNRDYRQLGIGVKGVTLSHGA